MWTVEESGRAKVLSHRIRCAAVPRAVPYGAAWRRRASLSLRMRSHMPCVIPSSGTVNTLKNKIRNIGKFGHPVARQTAKNISTSEHCDSGPLTRGEGETRWGRWDCASISVIACADTSFHAIVLLVQTLPTIPGNPEILQNTAQFRRSDAN